jgi:cell division transport system permease protein
MYALQQAMRAIRSNWVASVSTLTTMTVSLVILAGFSLISLNLNQVVADLEGELEIAAYLNQEANAPGLRNEIASWSEVARAELITPEHALMTMLADFPYMAQAADLVANPLPPTIRLQLFDPVHTPAVSQRLRQLPGIDGIDDGSDAVETFLAGSDALRVAGTILILILLSSALFAIVNSIRAAISARRDEIEVMRLVGATRGFIRAPFLLEGFLLGLFSAAIALALVIPGYGLMVRRLSDNLPFVTFVSDPMLLAQVVLLLAALALLVGLVGSAISVAQYLKEQA